MVMDSGSEAGMTDVMKRIYLDYAASTPVDKRVIAAMTPYFNEKFGNPGSLHWFGQEAEAAVFAARQKIARALSCDPEGIIFTGSATEANNLALRATVKNVKIKMKNYSSSSTGSETIFFKPKIIISAIEHESILETAADLEREGVEIVKIPVSREGLVDLEKLKAALDERTILVSVMYANNEIGTIQPIFEISKIIKEFKNRNLKYQIPNPNEESITQLPSYPITYPLFHTDAVQAFQYLPCKPSELGVDLMTLSAHKIYGPKGIGMLYAGKTTNTSTKTTKHNIQSTIIPIITGGEQERGMRAGTENVPYIVGFGAAVALAEKMREREALRVEKLRNYFWRKLQKVVSRQARKINPNILRASLRVEKYIEINGSLENRLPNNLNIYFGNHRGEIASQKPRNDEGGGPKMTKSVTAQELLVALDINGIAASSGSACRAHTTEPSKVIMALGHSRERALSSLRFTLGRATRKADIDKTVKILLKYLQA
jgi:cysteine desulfurase